MVQVVYSAADAGGQEGRSSEGMRLDVGHVLTHHDEKRQRGSHCKEMLYLFPQKTGQTRVAPMKRVHDSSAAYSEPQFLVLLCLAQASG